MLFRTRGSAWSLNPAQLQGAATSSHDAAGLPFHIITIAWSISFHRARKLPGGSFEASALGLPSCAEMFLSMLRIQARAGA